jgi:hypothetical protein
MVCATHPLHHVPVPVAGRLFAFLFYLVPFVTLLKFISEVAGGRRRTDGSEIRWEITPPMRWAEKAVM